MMLKNITLGVAAVSAFGLATAAVADGNDLSGLGSNNSGFYVRAQGGYDILGKDSETLPTQLLQARFNPTIQINRKKSDGFVGGAAVGYDVNQYFGVETGFNYLNSIQREYTGTETVNGTPVTYSGKQEIALYDFDVLGKATIPFNQFYGFLEGGAAYVHAGYGALPLNLRTATDLGTLSTMPAKTRGFIRPVAGVGVGYNVTNNVAVDVSYQRIFGKDNVDQAAYLPNLNLVSLGVTYKF